MGVDSYFLAAELEGIVDVKVDSEGFIGIVGLVKELIKMTILETGCEEKLFSTCIIGNEFEAMLACVMFVVNNGG